MPLKNEGNLRRQAGIGAWYRDPRRIRAVTPGMQPDADGPGSREGMNYARPAFVQASPAGPVPVQNLRFGLYEAAWRGYSDRLRN